MHRTTQALAALTLALSAGAACAQATPVGLWKTIDDATKKEKSLVRIVETGGVLSARVERVLDPDARPDATCEQCAEGDERRGQPIVGLTIIRGVKKSAGEEGLWEGGDILDPNNGKVYRVRLKPVDGGRKLEVRGYVGAPLLGRTQTWVRAE